VAAVGGEPEGGVAVGVENVHSGARLQQLDHRLCKDKSATTTQQRQLSNDNSATTTQQR
jgi:hypothetical protein